MIETTPAEWARQMMQLLSPSRRRQVIRKIMLDMRRRNAARIRSQQSADGAKWPARKQLKKGRRKMLLGFARVKHLKTKFSAEQGELGFSGRAGRLAQIHHYGMLDNVSRDGPRVEYPARPLLGLSAEDEAAIDAMLLEEFGSVRSLRS